jgi:penicillin-binding protein 2
MSIIVGRKSKQETVVDAKRRNFILTSFLMLCGALIARLWYLQILRGSDFFIASQKNRLREIIKAAPRGRIYDSYGNLLLSNRLFFDLVVIPQYLHDVERTLGILAKLFHIPPPLIEKRLKEFALSPKFVPIQIKKNLSAHEVALLESNKFFLPGVDIIASSRRNYIHHGSSHLFGYLGEVTQKELDYLNNFSSKFQYRVGSIIGKTGIERKYENFLRGEEGKEFLQVDAFGRLSSDKSRYGVQEEGAIPVKRGHDVYLSIDNHLQQACINAFKEKNGAICVINPQSGYILSYVSNPSFKLSLYQKGISSEEWQILQTNPFKPLLDKVTGGVYPPGSTFKMIMAVAALEEGVVTPEKTFSCPGYFTLGNGRWRCWKHTGHGAVNLRTALQQSCDVYFYNIGNMLGVEKIHKWSKEFGFGEKTGLDMNMEHAGIAPSIEWKLKTKGYPWQSGDTINLSIGQGYCLATPLQILNAYAAFGNGGLLFQPQLVTKIIDSSGNVIERTKPNPVHKINMKPETISAVRAGLADVVMSPMGTGRQGRVNGHTVAGKTGTVQNAALKYTKGVSLDNVAFQALDHAIFVSFSPVENPEIAVVVFSEYEGAGGGSRAAPIAADVIQTYWDKKQSKKKATDIPETSETEIYTLLQDEEEIMTHDIEI